ALNDGVQVGYRVGIQAQHQPEAPAQGRADEALPGGGADGRVLRHGQGVRPRARPHAHQDVHAEILQRRVEHLLHVRHQAVNLVDEENLVQADIAQNAGQVEFFLQNRPRRGGQGHAELLGDDGGERRLAETRRPVQQDVIHRLAALAGGLDGDLEVLLQLPLSGEIGQPPWAEAHFKLQIFGLAIPRNQFPIGHVLPAYRRWDRRSSFVVCQLRQVDRPRKPMVCPTSSARRPYRTSSKARRKRGSNPSAVPPVLALRTAASACGGAQPRFSSADSTSWSMAESVSAGGVPDSSPPVAGSLSRNSSTMRSAVFLPTPGTFTSFSTSPRRIARIRSGAARPESTFTASVGPIPLTEINFSNSPFSSCVRNP